MHTTYVTGNTMVWPYIVIGLGSIVGYDLLKSWLESHAQADTEMKVSPAIIIILVLLAIYMLRR